MAAIAGRIAVSDAHPGRSATRRVPTLSPIMIRPLERGKPEMSSGPKGTVQDDAEPRSGAASQAGTGDGRTDHDWGYLSDLAGLQEVGELALDSRKPPDDIHASAGYCTPVGGRLAARVIGRAVTEAFQG